MTTTPGKGHNDPVAQLLVQAKELGAQKARGIDTLVQFGILCVNAAYNGQIDQTKNKHGASIDDAVRLYAEFEKGRATASIFDHKSASGKVQAAKLRTCIKLGGWTRGGAGEPIATMNKLMDIRRRLRLDPIMRPKLDDAYATLLRWGRYQVKQTEVVDDPDALRAFCLKAEGLPMTLEDYLAGTAQRLDDLRSGKAAGGTLRHTSPAVLNALSELCAEIAHVKNSGDDE